MSSLYPNLPSRPHPSSAWSRFLEGRTGFWLGAVAMAFLMVVAAFLRIDELGDFGFWHDEYFHVFAAKSLLENGSLYVPTVGEYTRSLPITWMTAASFKLFGESEFWARLPFALVNVAFIPFCFWIARRTFNATTAWLFAAAMALSPFSIEMSREARMYTVFQFVFFFMAFSFLWGFEPASQPSRKAKWLSRFEAYWKVRADWLAAAAILFPISLSVHELTLNFGLMVAGYCGILFFYAVGTDGLKRAAASKYGVILAAFVSAVLFLAVFRPEKWADLLDMARNVPNWARLGPADIRYYHDFLWNQHLGPYVLFVLGTAVAIAGAGRRHFFVAAGFVGLYILHLFVFGRKDYRYLFYIYPFMVLTAAAGAAFLCRGLVDYFAAADARFSAKARIAASVLACSSVLLWFACPWIADSYSARWFRRYSDWKTLPNEIVTKLRQSRVLTSNPMHYSYYVGRPAYFVGIDEIQPDERVGRHFADPASVTQALSSEEGLTLVLDKWNLDNPAYFEPGILDKVAYRYQPVKHSGDPRIKIFEPIGAGSPPETERP